MDIDELYNELKEQLREWTGEYYLTGREGERGITIGGSNEHPQEIIIEVLNEDHPDTDQMELTLRRIVGGTEWRISGKKFFTEGFSDSTRDIAFGREVEPPRLLEKEFDESERIE